MSNGTMTIQGEAAYGAGIRASRKVANYEARMAELEAKANAQGRQIDALKALVRDLVERVDQEMTADPALANRELTQAPQDCDGFVFDWETHPVEDDPESAYLDSRDSAGYPTW